MRIALIGNGKMGQSIKSVAPSLGIKIALSLDSKSQEKEWGQIKEVDVCIDFSRPDVVLENIEKIGSYRKPMVIGTTGWDEKLSQVKTFIEENSLALIYAHNFSIGMNLFMQIVGKAASLIDRYEGYDIALMETHHKEKVDSPSGTALALSDIILQNMTRKKNIQREVAGKRKEGALYISSLRVGSVCGEHTVAIDSKQDSITLTHQSHNRSAFAYGALKAAEWIQYKKGFFNIRDMLEVNYANA